MIEVSIGLLIGGVAAGFIGSLFGVGGGIVIVPLLTLFYGYDIRTAIATSLTAIIVTSVMSSSLYIEKKLVNVRVALYLIPFVITGSFIGAHINVYAPTNIIEVLFAVLLFYTSYLMISGKRSKNTVRSDGTYEYFDEATKKKITYSIESMNKGRFLSFLGGIASGLLGIGGGSIIVPVLNLVMQIPFRVSVPTSLVIVGAASSTGATVYLVKGILDPLLASMIIIGIIVGVYIGTYVMTRISVRLLRYGFALLLFYAGIKMLLRGMG